MNHFHLCVQRGHVSIFCSQHLMQVMNCSVVWNVHGGPYLYQWTKLLCVYILLNTWCRWLTIMDMTLCVGLSTNGTTLCCKHVSNSWQSTLKNIHDVNTCPYDDFHYELILPYSIYVMQILSLTTLMIIVHGSAVQESTKGCSMTNDIKMHFCVVCNSTWHTNLKKYHIKNHIKCSFCCVCSFWIWCKNYKFDKKMFFIYSHGKWSNKMCYKIMKQIEFLHFYIW